MKISINLKRLPIEIEYEYVPEEKCIRYDRDLCGYPGYPAQVLIHSVTHANVNIDLFIDEMDWWNFVEDLILEEINKNKKE